MICSNILRDGNTGEFPTNPWLWVCRNYIKGLKEAAEADEAKFKQEEERALMRERRLTADAELKVLQARQKAEALGLAPPMVPAATPTAGPVDGAGPSG